MFEYHSVLIQHIAAENAKKAAESAAASAALPPTATSLTRLIFFYLLSRLEQMLLFAPNKFPPNAVIGAVLFFAGLVLLLISLVF